MNASVVKRIFESGLYGRMSKSDPPFCNIDDLTQVSRDVQIEREDIATSVQRVEHSISQFLAEVDSDTVSKSTQDFFKNSNLFSLDHGLTFTQDGLDYFYQYYVSNLPYQKYIRKLEESD